MRFYFKGFQNSIYLASSLAALVALGAPLVLDISTANADEPTSSAISIGEKRRLQSLKLIACRLKTTGAIRFRAVCQGKRWDPVDFTNLSGQAGATGAQGPRGDKGDTGEQGATGLQGIAGPQGERGLQGIQGEVGPQGAAGQDGAQGPQGIQGARGEQGPAGTINISACRIEKFNNSTACDSGKTCEIFGGGNCPDGYFMQNYGYKMKSEHNGLTREEELNIHANSTYATGVMVHQAATQITGPKDLPLMDLEVTLVCCLTGSAAD